VKSSFQSEVSMQFPSPTDEGSYQLNYAFFVITLFCTVNLAVLLAQQNWKGTLSVRFSRSTTVGFAAADGQRFK